MNNFQSISFINGSSPVITEKTLPKGYGLDGHKWEEINLTSWNGSNLTWVVRRNDKGQVTMYSGMSGLKSYKTLKGLRNYAKGWVIK